MDDDFLPSLRPRIHVVDDDGFYDHYYWDRQREERHGNTSQENAGGPA